MEQFLPPAAAEPAFRVDAYPPDLPGLPSVVYRRVEDKLLRLWFRYPKNAAIPRPAVLFFFGGGFRIGTPAQFDYQARALAAAEVVGILADYRVSSRDGVSLEECVEDARAALALVRTSAERLGLDPNRIAAAGGSAGGHLAAGLSTFARPAAGPGPDALVLFNPLLVMAPLPGIYELDPERVEFFEKAIGWPVESISAAHHLGPDLPPTLIMHGEADSLIPCESASAFDRLAGRLDLDCRLITYPGADHGFFNAGASQDNALLRETTLELLRFLGRNGWIEAETAI
jgi:acetyl esterase/lipase